MIFHGGGAQKIMGSHAMTRARSPKSLTAGVPGPLKGPEIKLSGFLCCLVLFDAYF